MSSSHVLSDAQLNFLADEAIKVGFSVKAFGPNAGERASYGYMVGTSGHGHDIFPESAITGQHIRDYTNSKEDVLSQKDMYLGGWIGGKPKRASLDVSKRVPSTLRGKHEALTAMIHANQEAAGHVMEPDDYSETKNPFYDEHAPQTGRPLTGKEQDWVNQQTFPLGRKVADLFRKPHGE